MSDIVQRKKDHLVHSADPVVDHSNRISPFDQVDLPYNALPELDMAQINLETEFIGMQLSMPLLISSMSGGPAEAGSLNEVLAIAAEREKVALGLGSMRVILEKPETIASFDVKQYCPNIPLLGNIGAVQLNYGVTVRDLNGLVERLQLDAMILHLNALQEAVQPEGDVNFEGLLRKLESVVKQLNVPVMAKEVGAGLSQENVHQLIEVGIEVIDVSGTGGTSWAKIEGMRREGHHRRLGDVFHAWGIPTPVAVHQARMVAPDSVRLIAGGGVRTGLDIAKACYLGADIATMARPFLLAYQEGSTTDEKVVSVQSLIQLVRSELRIACFGTGVLSLDQLRTLASFNEQE